MSYETNRAWLSVLLSFVTLISYAAMAYYFTKKMGARSKKHTRVDDWIKKLELIPQGLGMTSRLFSPDHECSSSFVGLGGTGSA
jgi:hypothetical protein